MTQLSTNETVGSLYERLSQQHELGAASAEDLLNLRVLEADLGMPSPNDGTGAKRIAIVSLLFNWPSTGGGIVHTAELATFLSTSGFEVCHFYAVNELFEVGKVQQALPYNAVPLHFNAQDWNRETIGSEFHRAVKAFSPDCVIVTDSWNMKPILAEAVSEWPFYLRLAAMECLCPLNNVRLICDDTSRPIQCGETQLASRDTCVGCVQTRPRSSGGFHVAERQLAGFENSQYGEQLLASFSKAEAVLVVNEQIASLVEPYTGRVEVIPSGFDVSRFRHLPELPTKHGPFKIMFAGLVQEYMKGFHIALEACQQLWQLRQDFELWVTGDTDGQLQEFVKPIGWQSQERLPYEMRECDVVVVPTVAQEALGRTAVEAMGASRAVIASRLGGLKEVVEDGVTGLLVNPADPSALASAIDQLMNDRALTKQLGENGRKRFEQNFTWETIIEHKYKPLFASCRSRT